MPESRHGLTCESLVDPALVSDLFNTDVAPADPIVTASGVGIAIPRITSILSVGGTVCQWSSGAAYNSQYGEAPEYTRRHHRGRAPASRGMERARRELRDAR